MAVAGAGAGAEIMVKSKPGPKINNFGSATLLFGAINKVFGLKIPYTEFQL